ncbi:hypothetical protein [Salinihabitans flavidus]|nr:hypothetical protein [Salinihabitans flavidus]
MATSPKEQESRISVNPMIFRAEKKDVDPSTNVGQHPVKLINQQNTSVGG